MRFHKKYLSPLKVFVIILYVVVIPYLETPAWCLQKLQHEDLGFVTPCHTFDVPYSGNLTLAPYFTLSLDMLCLSFFLYFKWSKLQYKLDIDRRKVLATILSILSAISILSSIICIILVRASYVSVLVRPFVLACFLKLVRQNAVDLMQNFYDSATVIIFIFLFVWFYSLLGYILFMYNFESI